MFEKTLSDLIRGIRAHSDDEVNEHTTQSKKKIFFFSQQKNSSPIVFSRFSFLPSFLPSFLLPSPTHTHIQWLKAHATHTSEKKNVEKRRRF
jgi:hypothetical protein